MKIKLDAALGSIRWPWILALTVTMGVLNGLFPRTLLLNPAAGLFLCILLWFTKRPFTWWYDVFFFASLLALILVAWLVSIAACVVLNLLAQTSRDCQIVASPQQLLGSVAFLLVPCLLIYAVTYVVYFARTLSSRRKG